jgi:hypothetical protein
MTCNAIYSQKARTKSKTSVAQTVSQPTVYAKGFDTQFTPQVPSIAQENSPDLHILGTVPLTLTLERVQKDAPSSH